MKALSMSMVMNNAIPSKKRHILQGIKVGRTALRADRTVHRRPRERQSRRHV